MSFALIKNTLTAKYLGYIKKSYSYFIFSHCNQENVFVSCLFDIRLSELTSFKKNTVASSLTTQSPLSFQFISSFFSNFRLYLLYFTSINRICTLLFYGLQRKGKHSAFLGHKIVLLVRTWYLDLLSFIILLNFRLISLRLWIRTIILLYCSTITT